MNSELVWVLCLLAGAIYLFMTNKVRMDVVALLIIILFVLSGTLTLPEALAGCKAVRDLMTGKTHNAQGGYVTLALGACEGAVLGRAEA